MNKKRALSMELLETRENPSVSLFDTGVAAPAMIATPDTAAVELGVRFTADADGAIDQVRFYRGAGSAEAFTASLWEADGTLLATGSAVSDLGNGWFGVRIPATRVEAGEVYVASYHAPGGQYAFSPDYFAANPTDAGLIQSAGAGSGVFAYGNGGVFPTSTFRDANYWVTPVYAGARVLYVTDGGTLLRVDAAGNRTPVVTNLVPTSDLAVAADGTLFVPQGSTVRRFAPSGASLGQFETGQAASAVAVEASGNLLVLSSTSLRRYTPGGQLLATLNTGTINSGLSNPSDIELGADGTIYVANASRPSQAITRIAPNGAVSTFGPGFVSELAVAGDGTIFATYLPSPQASFYQLVRLSPTGAIQSVLAAGLDSPLDLKFAPDGNLYLRESSTTTTATVRVFTPSGTELPGVGGTFASVVGALEFGPDTPPPASLFNTAAAAPATGIVVEDTAGVELGVRFTVDTAGTIDQVRFFRGAGTAGAFTASLWDADGTLLATGSAVRNLGNGWVGVSFDPVAVSPGRTYVASYYAPGGQYAFSHNYFAANPVDAGPIQSAGAGSGVFAYGGGGVVPTNNYLDSNYWVAPVFTPSPSEVTQALYVSEGTNILRVDRQGNRSLFAANVTPIASQPAALATDAAGNVYATSGDAVRKFAPTGADLGVVGRVPRDATGPGAATAVAVEANGNVLVTDFRGRLFRFSPDGVQLGILATGLRNPGDIELAADGTIFVANLGAFTQGITRVAPNGAVTQFGPGFIGRLALAPDGSLYASRLLGFQGSDFDVVQLSPTGTIVRTLVTGRPGRGDLDIGPDGTVYYQDTGLGTVRVFAPTGAELFSAVNGLSGSGSLAFGRLPT